MQKNENKQMSAFNRFRAIEQLRMMTDNKINNDQRNKVETNWNKQLKKEI